MDTLGGLKLALEGADRNDRRVRAARLVISDRTGIETPVVTDSDGRLRYRLPDGEYILRGPGSEQADFSVADHRWTTVRLRLA